MKFITLNEEQLNALTHTLQNVVEVYEEGDNFDQTVATNLREILEQLETLQAEEE